MSERHVDCKSVYTLHNINYIINIYAMKQKGACLDKHYSFLNHVIS